MNAKTKSNPNETCESIKLGIDAHAKWYYVGRQVDGSTPQSPFLTRHSPPPHPGPHSVTQLIDELPPLPNTGCIQPPR
jgi:hypothetical protein